MDADSRNAEVDADRIAAWLAAALDPSISAVSVRKLAGGHSSGAWRIDAGTAAGPRALVLKAPLLPSVVFRRDAGREGRVLDALSRGGTAVPAVVVVDGAGRYGIR